MESIYYDDLGIVLYLTPIVCMYCFAFALFTNKQKTSSQTCLAVCMAMIATGMLFSFYYDRYLATDHSEILRSINFITTFLSAISVLVYFTSLMQPQTLTRRYIGRLLLLAAVFFIAIIISEKLIGELNPVTGWGEILSNLLHPTVIYRLVASLLIVAMETYIGVRVIKMYLAHRKYIRNAFSYGEGIDLKWLHQCIFLFIILALSDIIWMINSGMSVKIFFNLISIYICFHLFYLGFRQKEIPIKEENNDEMDFSSDAERISSIKPSARQLQLKMMLEEYLRNESPYLNPELSLNDVAKTLDTSASYLSRLINREFNTNFYSLINGYRLEYAISLLETDNGKMTGETLAASSGFKSRSVFYKQFKEKTGYSPQDYKKKLAMRE